eukprot:CAMPEP_0182884100 /NCGR_PEP_ID=MMETSP0034_2-20130328/18786_1 /TAXON_ID=156128 /ORGANISM="Nephroselmis pyriformis, Strain CCMP717" /LENGTH=200 /DNA_ID=CAMNT_0025017271 /DNA_START=113 /DNA_END=715 /DNA_ORIENTATION=-
MAVKRGFLVSGTAPAVKAMHGGRALAVPALAVPRPGGYRRQPTVCMAEGGHEGKSSGLSRGFGKAPTPPESDADALLQSLDVAAKAGNVERPPDNTTTIMGMDNDEAKWRELDEKVNEYPCLRGFKAIGSGDGSFVGKMVTAVESVVGDVPEDMVRVRPSSKGKYSAVDIGPVMVMNVEQVMSIYAAMKEHGGDDLKWIL